MTTLFCDTFQHTKQWTGNDLVLVNDELNKFDFAATLASTGSSVKSESRVIFNPNKNYKVSFEYRSVPKTIDSAVNLGCLISINDGGSSFSRATAYGGSIKISTPPVCETRLIKPNDCIEKCFGGHGVPGALKCISWKESNVLFDKSSNFIKFSDSPQWNKYEFSFTAVNDQIRIGLSDFIYADYPNNGFSGDCYFANLTVTDSENHTDCPVVNFPTATSALLPFASDSSFSAGASDALESNIMLLGIITSGFFILF